MSYYCHQYRHFTLIHHIDKRDGYCVVFFELMMGEISVIDKMKIHTLPELGLGPLGYKATITKYRDKQ